MTYRKRTLVVFIGLCLCLSLTISGCGLQALLGNKNKTSSAGNNSKPPIIAVSLDEKDPNKLLITKGIDDLAKKGNVKVKYLDSSQAVDDSALKGAKVLIYQGGNANLLKNAQTNKVPVLALNQVPAGANLAGIVTSDQEKTGELMAQSLVSKVSDGQVIILQGDPSETGSQELLAGNKAVLSKYPKISIQTIASPQGAESTVKQSLNDFLQKNPGKVQGILAPTAQLSGMASDVLKQLQLDKKVLLIGGQASISSLDRMASGSQTSDVDTSPYLQGANAFQWAQKVIDKEPLDLSDSITSEQGDIPAKIIQVKAVTPDNLAVIQKSYVKTMQSAQQDQKKQTSKAQTQSKEQGDSKNQGDSKDKQGSKQSASGSSDQAQTSGNVPPGVAKVTETVKTETTREYLDSQGKVIGTEKTTNQQVKTVPPEMLQTEGKDQSSQGQSKDQGSQSSQDKSGGGGDSGG
ncbi:ABC-type sugar transport system, periplasmic component [Desulfosporosinus acidiphilus SJ4]|uniref:ABC-type sugar transport system, periplasmic component n=1 Tax=Desulfosporosinus acidiphilus (strain DSM 22704 / JCM 16185 / SJ4) TaxID=646529 RepID=I4DCA4_DESAJ|nr:substrate-binding domain-containing protein [Desulfosporosinus acidiphilus]AFM43428.1 ABC-type sugar transport system, periplasmic component [Desulfosporosinus acidiphilus SJ4]